MYRSTVAEAKYEKKVQLDRTDKVYCEVGEAEEEKKISHTCSVRSRGIEIEDAMVMGTKTKKNNRERVEQTKQRAVGKFESELFTFVSVACR